jgi:hypothetical protein
MNRIRRTIVLSIVTGGLFAAAAAGPVAAVAPDNAGCVGQFASTGGTTAGAGFGELLSGAAKARHPLGANIVRIEAHSHFPNCAFTYPPK